MTTSTSKSFVSVFKSHGLHSAVASLIVYGVGINVLQSMFVGILYFAASSAASALVVYRGDSGVSMWNMLASVITLSLVAIVWVLGVSHDDWRLRIAVSLGAIGSYVVVLRSSADIWSRVIRENLVNSQSSEQQFQRALVVFPGIGLATLGLRGFVTMIPLAVALLIGGIAIYRSSKRLVVLGVAMIGVTGAHLSHVLSARHEFWFFMSFDQVFRSSIATGLTRWGWTDSNLFSGVPLRYHWLSEASAGVASRLTGIDEFVMVTRVIPVLLFMFTLLTLWWFLMSFNLLPWPTLSSAVVVAMLTHPFDQYSIGTLYGLGLTYLVLLLITGWCSQISTAATPIAIAMVLLMLMMSQAPLGLVAIGTAGLTSIWLLIRRRVDLRQVVPSAVVFIVCLWILRQTLLAPSAYTDTQARLSLGNVLQFATWDVKFGQSQDSRWIARAINSLGHLSQVAVAVVPALVIILKSRSRDASLDVMSRRVVVGLLAVSLVAVNLVTFGGSNASSGKILDLVIVVFMPTSLAFLLASSTRWGFLSVAVVAFGVLVADYSLDYVRNEVTVGRAGLIAFAIVATVAIVLVRVVKQQASLRMLGCGVVAVVGVGISGDRDVLSILTRPAIPRETVIGSPEFQRCTTWLRTSTNTESVVATDLVYLPNASPPAEKYAGVSLFSKRRVYLDAPVFMSPLDVREASQRDDAIDSATIPIPNVDFYLVSQQWRARHPLSANKDLKVLYENTFCAVLGN